MAGTALGVPVVGTVIGALSGAAIGAARKRRKESFLKLSFPAKEVVEKGKSKENRPRGYQQNGTKKGNRQKAETRLG